MEVSSSISPTETDTIMLTYQVDGAQTSEPLIMAGTIQLAVETTNDKGTFTSSGCTGWTDNAAVCSDYDGLDVSIRFSGPDGLSMAFTFSAARSG